ncbi:glycerol-3-phosphate dehydrogenase/oxidase [Loigolactobacillus jiayinensis]|uniref:Alpha-glycerophosphate oxidase n=1 Tax=Loigolactobacillus jiayinensis TaxID=2486016 RepID=A0ABW1RCH8_9LACO|nr:glycerol-3-phosphate dehydrogenase/oxidase [Loigolactobacillus jiayinensis]
MMTFSNQTRQANLTKMQTELLDILVIGGGITGSGITLDAQTRGLQTGLLEMRDFASGTSSRSTKLVHGGLRYLKQFAIKEVAEVGQERAIVYENAPQVTTPVWMMLPFYKGGTFGSLTTGIGLDVYDRLAKVKKSERKFMLPPAKSLQREPYLKSAGLKGTGVYVEYRTDDARLTLEVVKKAHEKGALIANYTKVTSLLYDDQQRINGVAFTDTITGATGEIHARKVVNAAGPWVDTLRELDGSNQGKHLHLTKGVHLVIDHAKFPVTNAVFFDTPFNDGRMMFVVPREGKTYVGTTDTTWVKNPKEPDITTEDVTYILDAANQMFDLPAELNLTDVESAWSGVRPLIQEEGKDPSEISRKDEIFHSASGLFSIAGGKLTGYRKMAEKIVDRVARELAAETDHHYQATKTVKLPLSGGDMGGSAGFDSFITSATQQGITDYGLNEVAAAKLVHRYGTNVAQIYANLQQPSHHGLAPVDMAMLTYGLQAEMVLHPIDYLLRRSSQMLFDFDHMLAVKDAVIAEMADFYQWDAATTQAMQTEVEDQISIRTHFKQPQLV